MLFSLLIALHRFFKPQFYIQFGELVNQWQSEGRNYFQYQSTTPDRQKFTIYSGQYDVYRNNNYRIPIEVYHHPQHQQNVELIAEQVGKALIFYEQKFGNYPFEQVRVVEFVYYDGMVFSEGGVIGIPEVLVWKSEAQGLGKESIIDWVTYLLGYSWWEEQIISADVAGGMTIREALSSYGNLLYQRSRRTPQEQQLARQQLMRDYFRDLCKIDFKEPPLIDVYNELPIARFKGGMVLEQIENLIGEEALLAGIKEFLETYRYKSAPYPTVLDLQDAILKQAYPANPEIIRDLFANVVTYQVGLSDAVYQPLPNGKYQVKLNVEAQQLYTKNLGEQELKPLDFPVQISFFNQNREPIFSQKYKIPDPQTTVEIILNERPTYAAVDRDYILPSAFLQDHIKRVRPVSKNGR